MTYSSEPRDEIYVKGYGFLSFPKNIDKSLNSKCGQKFLGTTKNLAKDALKTVSKSGILKAAEVTSNLVRNKIAEKITKAAKNPPKNQRQHK